MGQKASVYLDKGAICNSGLLDQLREAVFQLEEDMRAKVPIFRHDRVLGYGVRKSQRGISADAVISVAKAIKSLKGW